MTPDKARSGYLGGVLSDGASPFRYRAGLRTLLGLPEMEGPELSFLTRMPRARFAYLRPRFTGEFSFGDEYPRGGSRALAYTDEERVDLMAAQPEGRDEAVLPEQAPQFEDRVRGSERIEVGPPTGNRVACPPAKAEAHEAVGSDSRAEQDRCLDTPMAPHAVRASPPTGGEARVRPKDSPTVDSDDADSAEMQPLVGEPGVVSSEARANARGSEAANSSRNADPGPRLSFDGAEPAVRSLRSEIPATESHGAVHTSPIQYRESASADSPLPKTLAAPAATERGHEEPVAAGQLGAFEGTRIDIPGSTANPAAIGETAALRHPLVSEPRLHGAEKQPLRAPNLQFEVAPPAALPSGVQGRLSVQRPTVEIHGVKTEGGIRIGEAVLGAESVRRQTPVDPASFTNPSVLGGGAPAPAGVCAPIGEFVLPQSGGGETMRTTNARAAALPSPTTPRSAAAKTGWRISSGVIPPAAASESGLDSKPTGPAEPRKTSFGAARPQLRPGMPSAAGIRPQPPGESEPAPTPPALPPPPARPIRWRAQGTYAFWARRYMPRLRTRILR